eukprot:NODE_4479_length_1058_cov_71.113369_g4277_i0.p1 GENE.NODE_4479_length_1058_cov_71.113369_g4277_i0~~NODE_4479_length_1058_cov_71.113369_g4277_i0.p1  ORF type:complete len:303 (+),score=38.53 NODE_4479_length_1058_cov_71.113369_g4277_i0:49-909(+)
MVSREQQHHGEYFCFYHSYSIAHLVYEVQGVLAAALYALEDEFAPLPRILHKPFDGKPTMDLLLKAFSKMPTRDHDPEFRALAICASVSLFGLDTEAPPLSCFYGGYSCTDLSFRKLLDSLFTACGLRHHEIKKVTDDILALGAKYGLMAHSYGASGSKRHLMFGDGCGESYTETTGHMLQIFLHKSVVDDIAYSSHAYGVMVGDRMPLSKYLATASPVQGQARIFMHPLVFTDKSKAIIYHYAANSEYWLKRPAFLKDLKTALHPILGSYTSLKTALAGIEARAS